MTSATIALLALAIQFTGPEIDRAGSMSVQWIVGGVPESPWTFANYDDGVYEVEGVDGRIRVERLSTVDSAYAVIGRDTDALITTAGMVVLQRPIPNRWRRGDDDEIFINADEVLVAFYQHQPTDIDDPENASDPSGESREPAAATSDAISDLQSSDTAGPVGARYQIRRNHRMITVSDGRFGETLVLSY